MKLYHIERSVLLPFAVSDMFDLVANVESYHEFVPWCQKSEIIERADEYIIGSLQVQLAGVVERVVTRNVLDPFQRIEMKLLKGPFSEFRGEWRFLDLGIGCKATLDLSFDVQQPILMSFASHFIEQVVERILKSFVLRAETHLVECE